MRMARCLPFLPWLGADVERPDCIPLLLTEVSFILRGSMDQKRAALGGRPASLPSRPEMEPRAPQAAPARSPGWPGREPTVDPLFLKTIEYASRFGQYNRDTFEAVRRWVGFA